MQAVLRASLLVTFRLAQRQRCAKAGDVPKIGANENGHGEDVKTDMQYEASSLE